MNKRGSVLIVSLWALSILSIYVANLGFLGAQHALLLKKELGNFEAKIDFLSGLNYVEQIILSDPEPYEDSFLEDWDRSLKLPDSLNRKVSIGVGDEESKLNLNNASEAFLKRFLKLFSEKVDSLKEERNDFVKAILKAREKEKIHSLEELELMEGIEKSDLAKLRPYFTVYPEYPQMNLNRIDPLILEALIDSLTGDEGAKKELFRKIIKERPFKSNDLEPSFFLKRLRLTPALTTLQIVNQLLPQITTDSRTFRLKLKSHSGKEAETVIQERGEGFAMEILSWHEGS